MKQCTVKLLAVFILCTVSIHGGELTSAIHGGKSFNEIKKILDSGADVNERDQGGYTPLRWVLYQESPDSVLDLLLTRGGETDDFLYKVERKRLAKLKQQLSNKLQQVKNRLWLKLVQCQWSWFD